MRNLNKIVKTYLSNPSDYAIQIAGGWGHGKTHYYKTILEPTIKNTETVKNASHNYKPIYISLFGLKSVEEIASKIVLELFQSSVFDQYHVSKSNKRTVQITQSVIKIALRGFLNISRLGSLKDYNTDIRKLGENVLDTSELVICFDDLERIDSSLQIEDLTGYINSLVDEGVKVLIISNEDLLSKKWPNYEDLKEKIIGITVQYIPDTLDTIRKIISNRYSSSPIFHKFLSANLPIIESISNAAGGNLRHLIYSLDCLHNIYSEIKNNILDTKHEITSKVTEELANIATISLILAIEYKSSAIKHSNRDELKDEYNLDTLFASINTLNKENKENKSPAHQLREKYSINKGTYYIYNSIYNFITGIDEFCVKSFIDEIKDRFHLESGSILPGYKLFIDLDYNHCFNLNTAQYRKKTLAVLENAYSSKYRLIDYFQVLHLAERFDNILELDLDSTVGKLIQAIKIRIESQLESDLNRSQFEMLGKKTSNSIYAARLFSETNSFIQQWEDSKKQEKYKNIANIITNDTKEFIRLIKTDQDYRFNVERFPILNYLDTFKLVENLKLAEGQTILYFRHFLKDRYEDSEHIKVELAQIKHLEVLITNWVKTLPTTTNEKLRNYLIKELLSTVTEIIKVGNTLTATVNIKTTKTEAG